MDEKIAVSVNSLNAALQAQVAKRTNAPLVTDEAAAAHVAAVVAPVAAAGPLDEFCGAWRTYYPKIVSLLGWASWVLPPQAINIIKGLLAVVNNEIVPLICPAQK